MSLWTYENRHSMSLINMNLTFDLTNMMDSNIRIPSVKLQAGTLAKGSLAHSGAPL
jgi:hypothetical protein